MDAELGLADAFGVGGRRLAWNRRSPGLRLAVRRLPIRDHRPGAREHLECGEAALSGTGHHGRAAPPRVTANEVKCPSKFLCARNPDLLTLDGREGGSRLSGQRELVPETPSTRSKVTFPCTGLPDVTAAGGVPSSSLTTPEKRTVKACASTTQARINQPIGMPAVLVEAAARSPPSGESEGNGFHRNENRHDNLGTGLLVSPEVRAPTSAGKAGTRNVGCSPASRTLSASRSSHIRPKPKLHRSTCPLSTSCSTRTAFVILAGFPIGRRTAEW